MVRSNFFGHGKSSIDRAVGSLPILIGDVPVLRVTDLDVHRRDAVDRRGTLGGGAERAAPFGTEGFGLPTHLLGDRSATSVVHHADRHSPPVRSCGRSLTAACCRPVPFRLLVPHGLSLPGPGVDGASSRDVGRGSPRPHRLGRRTLGRPTGRR